MRTELLGCFCLLVSVVSGLSWTATPYNPPAIPLAVRSPYLSAWLPGGNSGGNLVGQWPQFWAGGNLGWASYIRVDGTAYIFMGAPGVPNTAPKSATQTAMEFTASQSIFNLTAGGVDFTVTFLSPIDTSDLLRYSLPLSYMSVSVVANDLGSHEVQLYSDISAEWLSANDSLVATWNTTVGDLIIHETSLQSPQLYTEIDDRVQYGAAYYAVSSGGTYQTGQDVELRGQFIINGTLQNTLDTAFRPISQNWPVFAHAFDLGTVSGVPTKPTVFVIGFARDPAVQYIIADGQLQDRRSYFFSQYGSVQDAISFFLNDFANATATANAIDNKIWNDALAISSDYAGIVTLSARQAFGALELTTDPTGANPMLFLKEISSDGNVNTVDVINPTYPVLLYTNPALARYILEPLFQYQETGQYPNAYSVHDLGTHYPVADGHNNGTDEAMPVEECGNMLIMTAAYIKATNDTSIASSYYNLLTQWTSFLVNDALVPANQLSTDDFTGTLANQTNLAIKGIVGIAAMAQIANALGNVTDSLTYSMIAQNYVSQFQHYAISSDGSHLTLSYGNDSSWGLMYNLFADKLLGTQLFPSSIYAMQTQFYGTKAQTYGVPLDDRHMYALSDWEIFTSAAVTSSTARDTFISGVAAYLRAGQSNQPLPDLYDTDTGNEDALGFRARSVVGAHFAHLVLAKLGDPVVPSSASTMSTVTRTTAPSSGTSPSGSPSPTTASSATYAKPRICATLSAFLILSSLLGALWS